MTTTLDQIEITADDLVSLVTRYNPKTNEARAKSPSDPVALRQAREANLR